MSAPLSRITVQMLIKGSNEQAREAAVARMNAWFCDPDQSELELEAGYPVGSLLHFTVKQAPGHRAVAA